MKCFGWLLWILAVTDSIVIYPVNGSNDLGDLFSEDFNDAVEDPYSNDASLRTFSIEVVKKNLVFQYFKNGTKTSEDRGLEANLTESGCLPSDKFTFIIHGWGQDCEENWIHRLKEKLTEHRGGCIVCIDYSHYKRDSYLRILRFFRPMTDTITAKLHEMRAQGFEPSRAFIFGFSLGGQMSTAIGKMFGSALIKKIDTCDMAGPGFDFRRIADHRGAAEQVNCWHTSRNKGTRFYACDQNVRFGNCGHHQPGESPVISSHGLCLEYYLNAFDYPFYATLQPTRCMSRKPAVLIPSNFTVGYTEDSKSFISGEIFVPTSAQSPYNLPLEQVMLLNDLSRGNYVLEGNAPRRPLRKRIPVFLQNARNRLLRMIKN